MNNLICHMIKFGVLAIFAAISIIFFSNSCMIDVKAQGSQIIVQDEVYETFVQAKLQDIVFEGGLISIEVFKLGKSIGDLKASSANNLGNILEYANDYVVDKNGNANMRFSITGSSGMYSLRIGGAGINVPFNVTFVHHSPADLNSVLSQLNSIDPNLANCGNLVEEVLNGRYNNYPGKEIIRINTMDVYNIFTDESTFNNDMRAKVYQYIGKRSGAYKSAADVRKAFMEGIVLEYLNKTDNNDEYVKRLNTYASDIGIASEKIYTDIFKSILIDSNTKSRIISEMVKNDYSGKTMEDLIYSFNGYTVIFGIDDVNGAGDAMSLIEIASSFLEDNKGHGIKCNMVEYRKLKSPIEVCRKIVGKTYKDVDEFVTEFNQCVADQNQIESSPPKEIGKKSGTKEDKGGTSYQMPVVVTPVSKKEFSDLNDVEWARKSIDYLVENNVLIGRREDIFAPNEEITREEFIKMLVLAFKLYDQTAETDYDDVIKSEWYYKYISSATKAGIVKGDGNRFGTSEPITRQDMAVMSYRVIKGLGYNLTAIRSQLVFSDYDNIAEYAKDAVNAMQTAGIINGLGEHFAPDQNATRAQAAKIVCELLANTVLK